MKLLLLALILSVSYCSVKILSPVALKDKIGEDGVMQSSIANFGHIPYGHNIIGQAVHISDNEKGCFSFEDTLKSYSDQTPIVVVKRGDCSFVKKVRNAEHGGAKMVIVVDETNDENAIFISMVDDGTGNGIIIPSILVNKDPGNELIDFIVESGEEKAKTVKIMASFDMNHEDDHVEYDLIFSTSSDVALDFISEFRSYHDKLGGKAQITPHYISWPCYTCNDDILESDCFGNGKYCALDYYDINMTGKELLLGSIRQKCIYKNALSEKNSDADWWDYMIKAHSICYDDFTEDCSKLVHDRIGLDYTKTAQCVEDSFTGKGTDSEDNSILGEDYEYWVSTGFTFVPSVIINSVRYNGDFSADYIFEAICSGFADKPSECDVSINPTLEETSISKSHVKFNWFLFVVIVLVVFNVLLVIICIKRNKDTLKEHVRDAMSQHGHKFQRSDL